MSFTPTQINPKPARRRWFKIILLTLGLIIVAGSAFVYFVAQDLKTVDDADLIPEPVVLLMEDDNAYYVLPVIAELSELERVMVEEAVAVAAGRSSSSAQQAVNNTMFLTDAFITASKKKGYQCPTSVNRYSMNVELCSLNDLRNLAELTVLRAEVALAAGDIIDATESSLAIVRMAYYQSNSATTMIEQLVAMAMYNAAFPVLERIAVVADETEDIAITLTEYRLTLATLVRAYRVEYMQFKGLVIATSEGTSSGIDVPAPVGYGWHPNRTQQQYADFYRRVLEGTKIPCEEMSEEFDLELDARVAALSDVSPLMPLKPNAIGNMLIAVTIGSTNNIKQNTCEAERKYVSLIEDLRE